MAACLTTALDVHSAVGYADYQEARHEKNAQLTKKKKNPHDDSAFHFLLLNYFPFCQCDSETLDRIGRAHNLSTATLNQQQQKLHNLEHVLVRGHVAIAFLRHRQAGQ